MRKALMIGSTVADILIRVDHLPSLEEDVNPLGQTISLGGCCYNVSHMLELNNVPYTLFSPVGTGLYGTFVCSKLKEQGIEPVLLSNEENGCCYCIVDRQGSRTFLAVHGTEYRFRKEWFDRLDTREYTDAYICGLEVEEPSGAYIVEFIQNHPELNVFFAPSARIMHVQKERMEAILDVSPIVHLNRREAEWYLGECGVLEDSGCDIGRLASLLNRRTRNIVFVTDGANGAAACEGETVLYEPAVKARAIDGTGAGDAHIGTIMMMLMKGKSLKEALVFANRVAGRVTEVTGAVLSEEEYEKIRPR
jgi:sugar/nucleoside kinase (ribokinase family)